MSDDQPTHGRAAPARAPGDSRRRRAPGWRVTPAPDGRGQPQRPAHAVAQPQLSAGGSAADRGRAAGAQPVDLLAGRCKPNARVRDPLQPDLHRPGQGRQRHTTSPPRATRSRARSRRRSSTRPTSNGVQATKYFATQIPSFANNHQLSTLLEKQRRHVDATTADTAARRSSTEPDLRLRADAAARAAVRVRDAARGQRPAAAPAA